MTRNEAYNALREARKLPALPAGFAWVEDECWGGDPTVELHAADAKVQLQQDGFIEIEVDAADSGTHYIYLSLVIVNAMVKAQELIDFMEATA